MRIPLYLYICVERVRQFRSKKRLSSLPIYQRSISQTRVRLSNEKPEPPYSIISHKSGSSIVMEMEEEIKTIFRVGLSVLASLTYTYFIASKIPKGKLRLLSLLPIIYIFFIIPLPFSTALPAGVISLFVTWVGSFNLLLFSFGLGPLSSQPAPESLFLSIFIACLPIKTNKPVDSSHKTYQSSDPVLSGNKPPKLPLNLPTKVVLFSILVALTEYKSYLHTWFLLGQYCCMLYLFVDILVGSCNVIMRATIGIELE